MRKILIGDLQKGFCSILGYRSMGGCRCFYVSYDSFLFGIDRDGQKYSCFGFYTGLEELYTESNFFALSDFFAIFTLNDLMESGSNVFDEEHTREADYFVLLLGRIGADQKCCYVALYIERKKGDHIPKFYLGFVAQDRKRRDTISKYHGNDFRDCRTWEFKDCDGQSLTFQECRRGIFLGKLNRSSSILNHWNGGVKKRNESNKKTIELQRGVSSALKVSAITLCEGLSNLEKDKARTSSHSCKSIKSIRRSNIISPDQHDLEWCGNSNFISKTNRDPEKFIIDNKLTNAFSLAISLSALNDAIDNLYEETEGNSRKHFLRGMIGSSLYSNLKWKMETFPLTELSYSHDYIQLDVDQVSLEIKNLSSRVKEVVANLSNKMNSNRIFLNKFKKVLLRSVLNGSFPNKINTFSKSTIYTPGLKGGHTFMSSEQRNKFHLISLGEGEEVLRISFSIQTGLHNEESKSSFIHRNSFFFDNTETKILQEVYTNARSDLDKLWACILIVQRFLNTNNGNYQDSVRNFYFEHWLNNGMSGEFTFHVPGGILLHFLAIFQLSLLEDSEVHIALETYGGKSRSENYIFTVKAFQEIDNSRPIWRNELNCPVNIIRRFSLFMSEVMGISNYKENSLFWGVGCTFQPNSDVYVSFPLEKVQKFVAQLYGWELFLPDVHGDIFDVEHFPTFGQIPHMDIQPFLLQVSRDMTRTSRIADIDELGLLTRVQHYSVNARQAYKEAGCSLDDKATSLAARCVSNLSLVPNELGDGGRFYRYEHHGEVLNQVRSNLEITLNCMEKKGHAARLEIAVLSNSPLNSLLSLNFAFELLRQLVVQCVASVSLNSIIKPIRFFADSLRSRTEQSVHFLQYAKEKEALPLMLDHVVEECYVWRSFYSGRRLFSAPGRICKHLSFHASRPVICHMGSAMTKHFHQDIELKHLWDKFYQKLKLNTIPKIELGEQNTLSFRKKIIVPRACSCCFMLMECDVEDFRIHPCTEIDRNLHSLISCDDIKYTEYFEEFLNSLDRNQRFFVDNVSDFDNSLDYTLLTGFAGCGKSRTLKALITQLKLKHGLDSVAVCCFTKSAALEVNGITIHSLLNLKLQSFQNVTSEGVVSGILPDKRKRLFLEELKVLVIDEISLVDGLVLNVLDDVLRTIRKSEKPFGGLRVILCGDPLQLPPFLGKNITPTYFFLSNAWKKAKFQVFYLSKIYRQKGKDKKDIEILNKMRINALEDADFEHINKFWGRNISQKVVIETISAIGKLNMCQMGLEKMQWKIKNVYISGRIGDKEHGDLKDRVERTLRKDYGDEEIGDENYFKDLLEKLGEHMIIGNENVEGVELAKMLDENIIKSRIKHYRIESQDNLECGLRMKIEKPTKEISDRFLKESKFPNQIRLYKGQIVMFLANNISHFVGNNTLGIIEDFHFLDEDCRIIKSVIVRPVSEKGLYYGVVEVQKLKEEVFSYFDEIERIKWQATRKQFPIEPVSFHTIYSAQEKTIFGKVLFNNMRSHLLNSGSAYTAHSRVADFRNIFSVCAICKSDIYADPIALEFDEGHRKLSYELEADGKIGFSFFSVRKEFLSSFKQSIAHVNKVQRRRLLLFQESEEIAKKRKVHTSGYI